MTFAVGGAGTNLDSSSTVRKIRLLQLNDLRKDKRLLALHFPTWRLREELLQGRRYCHAGSAQRLRSMRRKLTTE